MNPSPIPNARSRFDAFEVSLEIIRGLRPIVVRLRTRDAELSSQLRRAAASVALNLEEGSRRVGRDRIHHFRIAAGSAAESRACLRVAEAWGHLEDAEVAGLLALLDRLLAMCWRLTH